MSRKGSPNKTTEDQREKWDALAKKHNLDPMDLLFAIAKARPKRGLLTKSEARTIDIHDRSSAAEKLLRYRWAMFRTIEFGLQDLDRELVMRWLDDSDPDDHDRS